MRKQHRRKYPVRKTNRGVTLPKGKHSPEYGGRVWILTPLLESWPDLPWLNALVYLAIIYTVGVAFVGPRHFSSPWWALAGGLWLLLAAGRVVAFLLDESRATKRRVR